MSDAWLRCNILKGMFSNELAVVVPQKSGKTLAVFVPKEKVRGNVNEVGTVQVQVFRDNGTQWAVLPTEDRALVSVNHDDLVAS